MIQHGLSIADDLLQARSGDGSESTERAGNESRQVILCEATTCQVRSIELFWCMVYDCKWLVING